MLFKAFTNLSLGTEKDQFCWVVGQGEDRSNLSKMLERGPVAFFERGESALQAQGARKPIF